MTASSNGPVEAQRASAAKHRLTPERLRDLLAASTLLPWSWVAGMLVIALWSAIDLTFPESGGMRWHVAVGAITLTAIGLIWLPTGLRLLSLTGGSVKAGGIEASTAGIIGSPDSLVEDLAGLLNSTEQLARDIPATEPSVRSLQAEVDRIATHYLPNEETLVPDVLTRLARTYQQIRQTMPSGQPRTIAMNMLVNEVRVRAAAAPSAARRLAPSLLRSSSPGDRIVGLALAQASPNVEIYDDLLRIFSTSVSAFEQYHSLLSLHEIVSILNGPDRDRAVSVLEREKSDPRGIGVMDDPFIPSWINGLLKGLRK